FRRQSASLHVADKRHRDFAVRPHRHVYRQRVVSPDRHLYLVVDSDAVLIRQGRSGTLQQGGRERGVRRTCPGGGERRNDQESEKHGSHSRLSPRMVFTRKPAPAESNDPTDTTGIGIQRVSAGKAGQYARECHGGGIYCCNFSKYIPRLKWVVA